MTSVSKPAQPAALRATGWRRSVLSEHYGTGGRSLPPDFVRFSFSLQIYLRPSRVSRSSLRLSLSLCLSLSLFLSVCLSLFLSLSLSLSLCDDFVLLFSISFLLICPLKHNHAGEFQSVYFCVCLEPPPSQGKGGGERCKMSLSLIYYLVK